MAFVVGDKRGVVRVEARGVDFLAERVHGFARRKRDRFFFERGFVPFALADDLELTADWLGCRLAASAGASGYRPRRADQMAGHG